jgi:hypothetical protein
MAKHFKVSYVVLGGEHSGAIVSSDKRPKIGEIVNLGDTEFSIVEVLDLLPPRGDFHYLHVTLQPESST